MARQEDEQVERIRQEATQKQTSAARAAEAKQHEELRRLYIEMDGVLARMRRGSVLMEQEERQRTGDVYREIKAGAVFVRSGGRKRSELAPGVYVDTPAEDSLRYVARRTAKGGFAGCSTSWRGWWARASEAGGRAGRWRAMDLESGRRTLSRGRCRSLISIMPKNTCGT